jgi:hypothetical protein
MLNVANLATEHLVCHTVLFQMRNKRKKTCLLVELKHPRCVHDNKVYGGPSTQQFFFYFNKIDFILNKVYFIKIK